MVTVPREIETFAGSLLTSVTVTPDAAGVESVTANDADCPSPRVTPAGRPIVPRVVDPCTVTVAVASVKLGALA